MGRSNVCRELMEVQDLVFRAIYGRGTIDYHGLKLALDFPHREALALIGHEMDNVCELT